MADIKSAYQMMIENQNKIGQLYSNIEMNSALQSINRTMEMLKPHYDIVDNAMAQVRTSFRMSGWLDSLNSITNINNQVKMMIDLGIRNDQFKNLITGINVDLPKPFEVQPFTEILDTIEEIDEGDIFGSSEDKEKLNFKEIKEKLNESPTWTVIYSVLTLIIIPMLVAIYTPNPALDKVLDRQETVIEQQKEQLKLLHAERELLLKHNKVNEEQMTRIEQNNEKILEMLRRHEEQVIQDIR